MAKLTIGGERLSFLGAKWRSAIILLAIIVLCMLGHWIIEGIGHTISDLSRAYENSIAEILYRARRESEEQYQLFKFAMYCIPVVFILRMIVVEMRRKVRGKDDDAN